MMFCAMQPTGEVRGKRFGFTCPHCRRAYWSNYNNAEKIMGRTCDPGGGTVREPLLHLSDYSSCQHRGPQLRVDECPTCNGNVKVKVFACAVHVECELANKINGVKFCGACRDFAPIEP